MAQAKTAKKGGRPANDEKSTSNTSTKKQPEGSNMMAMTEDQFNKLLSQFANMQNQQPQNAQKDQKTNQDLRAKFASQTNLRQAQAQHFFKMMAEDKKNIRTISIPKIYKDYTAGAITANVNGIAVKVPVDGRRYPIHKAHYAVIQEKLRYIDDQREKNQGNDNFFSDQGDYSKVETG